MRTAVVCDVFTVLLCILFVTHCIIFCGVFRGLICFSYVSSVFKFCFVLIVGSLSIACFAHLAVSDWLVLTCFDYSLESC